MEQAEIEALIQKQRVFFQAGMTLSVDVRINALKKLRRVIRENDKDIQDALRRDLGKSSFETYMCETGLALNEITHMLQHIRGYAANRLVPTPLAQFYSLSFRKPSPKGVVLVMSPWNYPFMLSLEPLVDAIAAGNTVILKPSAYSPATSEVIRRMISENFDPRYIAVVTGGRQENASLLNCHFDHIFFTGSQTVGRFVMAKAADHLTPVTLELGGKSPCVILADADLKLAARRIVFGKYLNCGQTCVAPDFVYVDRRVKDALLAEIKREIRRQYGKSPLENPDYGKIINQKHFDRIRGLMDPEKIVLGGGCSTETLQIEPTVMDNVTFEDAVMGEEIFGPLMPILTFEKKSEALCRLQKMPHPLALYIFTSNKKNAHRFLSLVGFGGGCINDTVIHLATGYMPFGGFGESGMGGYHGRAGFDTFTHYKSIVDKGTHLDLPMRYQPYRELYGKLLHIFLR